MSTFKELHAKKDWDSIIKEAEVNYEQYLKKRDIASSWDLYYYGTALRFKNEYFKSIAVFKLACEINNKLIVAKNFLIQSLLIEYFRKPSIDNHSLDEIEHEFNYILDNYEISEFEKDKKYGEKNRENYVRIIFSFIKLIREKRSTKSFSEHTLQILDKIDVTKLSTDEREYIDKQNNDESRVYYSELEEYFSHKIRVYKNLKLYEECISCCNLAFEEVEKLHHRNHNWFSRSKKYSMCMLSFNNNNLDEFNRNLLDFIKLSDRINGFFCYQDLGEIYESAGKIEEALFFYSQAMLTDFINTPFKMKLKSMMRIGVLYENIDKPILAKEHFILTLKTRINAGYEIKERHLEKQEKYKITLSNNYNLPLLKKLWWENISNRSDFCCGTVKTLTKTGRPKDWFGFINESNIGNVYFKFFDINKTNRNIRLNPGDIVTFKILKFKDKYSNQMKTKCTNIFIKEQ